MPVFVQPPIPISVPIPSRPPRNPARTKTVRPNTATGAPEDVTPWELYPAPEYPDASVTSVRIPVSILFKFVPVAIPLSFSP